MSTTNYSNAGYYIIILSLSLTLLLIRCNQTSPADNHTDSTIIENEVTDADGNFYDAIILGNQTWTLQNLKTTKFIDGTDIPFVNDSSDWANLKTPAFCYYNNTQNQDTIEDYGALYNWYAVNSDKLAPNGWHVPTVDDWDELDNYLYSKGYTSRNKLGTGVAKSIASKTGWRQCNDSGTVGWNIEKNNKSGFSAFPAGSRAGTGSFNKNAGEMSYWWSSTERSETSTTYFFIRYDDVKLYNFSGSKLNGGSIRFVKSR